MTGLETGPPVYRVCDFDVSFCGSAKIEAAGRSSPGEFADQFTTALKSVGIEIARQCHGERRNRTRSLSEKYPPGRQGNRTSKLWREHCRASDELESIFRHLRRPSEPPPD